MVKNIIFICPIENHTFWTERARMCLSFYLDLKGKDKRRAKIYKDGFIRNMGSRRNKELLEY